MRVLQVVTDDDRRGAQVFGVDLGQRLIDLGLEVETVALAAGRSGGLGVTLLGPRPKSLTTFSALRRAARQADVVVGHGSTTLLMGGIAALVARRPFVYRQISDPVYWTPTIGRRLRTAILYRLASRVVALSGVTAEVLRHRFRFDPTRITVIPNAVDEQRWAMTTAAGRQRARRQLGLPVDGRQVVGYVGALEEEKAVRDLIRAMPAGLILVVAGDGSQRTELVGEADRLGLSACFLGAIDDPAPVYAAADLLVLPSRTDMHPAVLIESALCGTPSLATDVGLVGEIVVDGVTGALVPSGDAAVLRERIEQLMADPGTLLELGLAARSHALAAFSMSAAAPRWLRLLEGMQR